MARKPAPKAFNHGRHLVVKLEISSAASGNLVWATCSCGCEWKLAISEREIRGRSPGVRGLGPCTVAPEDSAKRLYFDRLLQRARVLCAECIDAWQTNRLDADLEDLGCAPYAAPCENCVAEAALASDQPTEG